MEQFDKHKNAIGFFDSGVGGLSVLKKAIEYMPNENFIYFGDSKNAPYGVKSTKEVRELTFAAVEFLLSKGAKGIVIACNTATSAAINDIRKKYTYIPVIGIEPALKPAVEMTKKGKIIVMATNVTLSEQKFENLMNTYGKESEIIAMPCPGLVEYIEHGQVEGQRVLSYLENKFKNINKEEISTIVLGCTHYPFVKESIHKVVGQNVNIIDGALGTSKELKRRLEEEGLINQSNEKGSVKIYNSLNDEEIINLSYKLLEWK